MNIKTDLSFALRGAVRAAAMAQQQQHFVPQQRTLRGKQDPQDRAEEPGWSFLFWLELEGGRNGFEHA